MCLSLTCLQAQVRLPVPHPASLCLEKVCIVLLEKGYQYFEFCRLTSRYLPVALENTTVCAQTEMVARLIACCQVPITGLMSIPKIVIA